MWCPGQRKRISWFSRNPEKLQLSYGLTSNIPAGCIPNGEDFSQPIPFPSPIVEPKKCPVEELRKSLKQSSAFLTEALGYSEEIKSFINRIQELTLTEDDSSANTSKLEFRLFSLTRDVLKSSYTSLYDTVTGSVRILIPAILQIEKISPTPPATMETSNPPIPMEIDSDLSHPHDHDSDATTHSPEIPVEDLNHGQGIKRAERTLSVYDVWRMAKHARYEADFRGGEGECLRDEPRTLAPPLSQYSSAVSSVANPNSEMEIQEGETWVPLRVPERRVVPLKEPLLQVDFIPKSILKKRTEPEAVGLEFHTEAEVLMHSDPPPNQGPKQLRSWNKKLSTPTANPNRTSPRARPQPILKPKKGVVQNGIKSKKNEKQVKFRSPVSPRVKLPCPLCDKKFANMDSWSIHVKQGHMISNSGIDPIFCEPCCKGFVYPILYEEHVKEMHSGSDTCLSEQTTGIDPSDHGLEDGRTIESGNIEEKEESPASNEIISNNTETLDIDSSLAEETVAVMDSEVLSNENEKSTQVHGLATDLDNSDQEEASPISTEAHASKNSDNCPSDSEAHLLENSVTVFPVVENKLIRFCGHCKMPFVIADDETISRHLKEVHKMEVISLLVYGLGISGINSTNIETFTVTDVDFTTSFKIQSS